jgi:hypothetical protein
MELENFRTNRPWLLRDGKYENWEHIITATKIIFSQAEKDKGLPQQFINGQKYDADYEFDDDGNIVIDTELNEDDVLVCLEKGRQPVDSRETLISPFLNDVPHTVVVPAKSKGLSTERYNIPKY